MMGTDSNRRIGEQIDARRVCYLIPQIYRGRTDDPIEKCPDGRDIWVKSHEKNLSPLPSF